MFDFFFVREKYRNVYEGSGCDKDPFRNKVLSSKHLQDIGEKYEPIPKDNIFNEEGRIKLEKFLMKRLGKLDGQIGIIFFSNGKLIRLTPEQIGFLLAGFDPDFHKFVFANLHIFLPQIEENSAYMYSEEQRKKISKVSKLYDKIRKLKLPNKLESFNFIRSNILFGYLTYFFQLKERNEQIPYSQFKVFVNLSKAKNLEDVKGKHNRQKISSLVELTFNPYKSSNSGMSKMYFESLFSAYKNLSAYAGNPEGFLNVLFTDIYLRIILPIKACICGKITFDNLEEKLKANLSTKEDQEYAHEPFEKFVTAREAATKLVMDHEVNPNSFKFYSLRDPNLYPSLKKQEPSI
ncbi:MAG: hypothetical protein LBJ09_00930 [Clostridiales bacterium]|jgi:hypothetical protein|nr:hypothetical protein [Clostridiales bacterium]